jgi:hypothetical protein
MFLPGFMGRAGFLSATIFRFMERGDFNIEE